MKEVHASVLSSTPLPQLVEFALATVRTGATTVYEANIAESLSLGGLQRKRLLGNAAKEFAADSGGASPSDNVHPVLLALLDSGATAVVPTPLKKEKLVEASTSAGSSAAPASVAASSSGSAAPAASGAKKAVAASASASSAASVKSGSGVKRKMR